MRKILHFVIAAALIGLALSSHAATPAQKKSSAKTAAKSAVSKNRKAAATRKAAPRAAAKGASKKGRKAASRTAPVRTRQLVPTPERYKQIQEALAAKGYLPPEQANGQWTETSMDALKRFQADQKLDATGKINSLSLIALGLGPKHDPVAPPKEPATTPAIQ